LISWVMRRVVVGVVLLASCIEPRLTHCPPIDCPPDKVCDGHGGCALPAQVTSCVGAVDGKPCSYIGVPTGECRDLLCIPAGCGNGVLVPTEICDDGNNVDGDG